MRTPKANPISNKKALITSKEVNAKAAPVKAAFKAADIAYIRGKPSKPPPGKARSYLHGKHVNGARDSVDKSDLAEIEEIVGMRRERAPN